MGDRLVTIDMDRKRGVLCPLLGELDPHLTQCRLDRGLPSYQVASWSIQPFSHNTWAKSGGCPPRGGAGSPSNRTRPGPRPTSMPSFTSIHPTVWPQSTIHQRYRQTGQLDIQDRQTGQRSGSIDQVDQPFYKRSSKVNGTCDGLYFTHLT